MLCAQRTSKIRGRVLEILTSYLQGRRARTAVEGEFSEFVHISAGIPQASRLRPLLFIIYLNDLIKDLESLPLIYADDTTLISSEIDTDKTTSQLSRDLQKLSTWAKKNVILLSVNKCSTIICQY